MSPARTAGTTIALTIAVCVAGRLLTNDLAADAVQVAIAEVGATPVGPGWSASPPEPTAETAKRVARALAIGALIAAATFALARLLLVRPSFDPTWTPAALLAALVEALLVGARDELLLRGPLVRLLGAQHRAWTLAASALASMAWAIGTAGARGAPLVDVVAAGLAGALFGTLWLRDRTAWAPVAAHAALVFGLGGQGASPGAPALGPLAVAGAWCAMNALRRPEAPGEKSAAREGLG